MSVHPPRETKTRRGADRRALGGRRASPCGGALVPLWGKSFPSWDFGVSAAAFTAAPAGEYTLKVYTRSGLGDACGVKVAARKVTVG